VTLAPASTSATTTKTVVQTGGQLAKIDRNKKVKKEKIRFGQAPRNSLPAEQTGLAADNGLGANHELRTTAEVAPGTAIAPVASLDALNATPVSSSSDSNDTNPLAPTTPPAQKTRYSARAKTIAAEKTAKKTAKAKEKLASAPVPMTAEERAVAQTQASPLGLAGDTAAKPKKVKVKGAPKERLQDQPEKPKAPLPDETPAKAADRGTVYEGTAGPPKTSPSADATTLPAVTAPTSANPQSTVTPATPGNPIPTAPPQL